MGLDLGAGPLYLDNLQYENYCNRGGFQRYIYLNLHEDWLFHKDPCNGSL